MEQLTKNQAVATSQEAVQNQNEPQLRDENAHNDKSVHGVLNLTYKAGLRRDAVQPDIEAERNQRDEIVDDNDSVRMTMQEFLELYSCEVVSASIVNEAMSCDAAETFSVLFCDLHMAARGDGLSVLSAVRHDNANALTLVFSAYPEMKEA